MRIFEGVASDRRVERPKRGQYPIERMVTGLLASQVMRNIERSGAGPTVGFTVNEGSVNIFAALWKFSWPVRGVLGPGGATYMESKNSKPATWCTVHEFNRARLERKLFHCSLKRIATSRSANLKLGEGGTCTGGKVAPGRCADPASPQGLRKLARTAHFEALKTGPADDESAALWFKTKLREYCAFIFMRHVASVSRARAGTLRATASAKTRKNIR
ncbi:hypothetical protein H4582DRAFT_2128201 [Lactarius indigo]|nr:hypothetical protein H4582DRAFT_2128201 [Lactarius indigo]